ncbi:hypothetical protein [Oceanidesulfovibrio marinus]|uniref:Uncharacterized protein n=1 Tax=Oceanidesulfovibrio marinus TaxID=370038 RepID=A0A6P1ZIX6_9BACT|nr:hypothetical protein [Oceanidesulfovibrio marinus]TVM35641.1 hypothetical protein DQK91_02955 [Oceanidesulfovibrio marinus]
MTRNPKDIRINEMGNVERLTPNGGWQESQPAHMKYDAEAYRELQKDLAALSKTRLRRELANLQRFISDDGAARDTVSGLQLALCAVHSELSRISALV